MTCGEFMEAAGSSTPPQLLRMQSEDEQVSVHARECATCGKWLESRRLLGSALQALHARTALREAGPRVEQAVLQAFRTQGFGPVAAVAPERAAPAAWKLSRFFEIGAYAAVAAALIVGVFLGARMWRDRQAAPARVQATAVTTAQPVDLGATAVADRNPTESKMTEIARKSTVPAQIRNGERNSGRPQQGSEQAVAATIDRQGFVALMFCDPLICSGEEQVIRMELPASGADGNASQPVIADVVVGDDGLVRAMRIVN